MENTLEYKGYFTNIFFSANDKVLHGKIEGIDDLVTFESESIADIENEFHDAVDDYLAFCEEIGKEPAKTYKGSFNVRIEPELHRAIALNAIREGISLNQAVEHAIYQYVIPKDNKHTDYIASIEHQLSKLNGVLGEFSTACQITHLSPGFTYVSTLLPQNYDCWKGAPV